MVSVGTGRSERIRRLLCCVLVSLCITPYAVHGITGRSGAASTSEVTIAFYVTVSFEELPYLRRLFDRIYHPGNIYLIEYDPTIAEELFESFPRFRNVYQRHADPFTPSGVSAVLNVLDAIAFFFNREDVLSHDSSQASVVKFDYFIPVSPTSYPTVTPNNIRVLLPKSLPMPSFLHFGHPSQLPLFADDVDVVHVDLTLSFSSSAPRTLYTRHHSHPDKSRRAFKLPRAAHSFVASRPFAKFAVDSVLSKRLLLVLAETANVADRFFAALADVAPSNAIGPVIRKTSLHCTHSDALDEAVDNVLPNYSPYPPSVSFLQNVSEPCLFVAPFNDEAYLSMRNEIDKYLLIPPGTQGRPPGVSYHAKVQEKIHALLSSS